MDLGMISERVSENKGLVYMIAKRWEWRTKYSAADIDDLISEGYIGLIKAIKLFDPNKGFQFSSYACPMVTGQILNFLNNQLPQIHYPQKIRAMIKVIKAEDLTIKQVMIRFKCTRKLAKFALERAYTTVVSLNALRAEAGDDAVSFEDMIPSIEDYSTAHVDEFISTLPDAERALIELAFRDLNKLEISEALNVDYSQVSSKMKSIREKLKKYQAGLPYQGHRAHSKTIYGKIPQ